MPRQQPAVLINHPPPVTIQTIASNPHPMRLIKYKVGFIVGVALALFHALWLVLVVTGVGQTIVDFIFKIHLLNNPYLTQTFDLQLAGLLIVITFAVGFVIGWVFALLCNLIHKKK